MGVSKTLEMCVKKTKNTYFLIGTRLSHSSSFSIRLSSSASEESLLKAYN